jgi:hypothetical protein
MTRGGIFDLERQFAFYGAYHNNKINILIHLVFVWPILFTALLLLAYSKPLAPQLPLMAARPTTSTWCSTTASSSPPSTPCSTAPVVQHVGEA